MRKGFNTYAAYPLAFGLVAALAAGCGKKDKKDDSSPNAPDTWVTDSSVEGGVAKIKYKSSDANAKFKCQLEADGQKDAAWTDCPSEGSTLNVEAGVHYTFRVKAIGAGGEDKEPYSYTFVGGPSNGGQPQQPQLQTVILNKEDIDETYGETEMALELGIEGGPSADDVRFECKRENETSFRRCRATKSNDYEDTTYSFKDLKDGYIYSLAVRAVLKNGGTVASEDEINFRVELTTNPGLGIGGADKLRTQVEGQVPMTYPTGATCMLDQQTSVPCAPAYSNISLDGGAQGLQEGSHVMIVNVPGGGSETINFCVAECQNENPSAPVVEDFQLGGFYAYHIPEGMHMVQWATTETGTDMLWYRALNDPMSNDLDQCLDGALPFPVKGRVFPMRTGSGASLSYCVTSPTWEAFKTKTEYRRALNSMEVGTDVNLAMNGQRDERILFNVFDSRPELQHPETTLQRLCRNNIGGIFTTDPIRVIANDYYGEPVRAQFMGCRANKTEFTPQGPVSAIWWIGSFFISSEGLDMPEFKCMNYAHEGYNQGYCDAYWNRRTEQVISTQCQTPSLVEATIMIREDSRYQAGPRGAISGPEEFIREARLFFKDNLIELSPVRN